MDLFGKEETRLGLPDDYEPARPKYFEPEKIYLAKGSVASRERKRFVEKIIGLYPGAEVIESPGVPHNRIDTGEKDPLGRNKAGKRTLVFGEHGSSVRFSDEEGNTCPNYWHFSPYGYCPYGCKYCYLAGTLGVWHSPNVKVYLNIDRIIAEIDRTANRMARPTAFYLGKLQDGLALDPLTGYSKVFNRFFARHDYARQVILTKSDAVDNLLGLDHRERTILSWSLNPPEIASAFEENVPPVEARLEAMKKCAESGYPLRAVLMPVIPVPGWEELYAEFIRSLLTELSIKRLTIGGICIYKNAKRLMERKIGRSNPISQGIGEGTESEDGRARYSSDKRVQIYQHILEAARETSPDTRLALCLEEPEVWKSVGLEASLGRCNCVL